VVGSWTARSLHCHICATSALLASWNRICPTHFFEHSVITVISVIDMAAVRISNIKSNISIQALVEFLNKDIPPALHVGNRSVSLVSSTKDTNTATFPLASRSALRFVREACRRPLNDSFIHIDDKFLGFTVLSVAKDPTIEYGYLSFSPKLTYGYIKALSLFMA